MIPMQPIRGGIFGEPEVDFRKPAREMPSIRTYVVVDGQGVPWVETARSNRRDAIKAAVASTKQSWNELRASGCYSALAVLRVQP